MITLEKMLKSNQKLIASKKSLNEVIATTLESTVSTYPHAVVDGILDTFAVSNQNTNTFFRTALLTREIIVNAVSRGGDHVFLGTLSILGFPCYCILSNSIPFKSNSEIGYNFLTINQSDMKKFSMHGCGGLGTSLAAADNDKKGTIVGSNTPNGWQYLFGKNKAMFSL